MFEKVSSLVNGFMKHFNSPYMSFNKYNPVDINSGLCSMKNSKLERNIRNLVVIL